MSSEPVIDIESLLAPISEEAPTGEPLSRHDPESQFYLVQTARDDASNAEKAIINFLMLSDGEEDIERPAPSDWGKVIRLASETLQDTSKDFRIASWLLEGLAREHGFVGLRDGLEYCLRLCQTYWQNIHPEATEEDGHYDTVAMFDGVTDEAMSVAIKQLPITHTPDAVGYSMLQYEHAGTVDQIEDPESRAERIREGAVTYDVFRQAVLNTDRQFYIDLVADLQRTLEHIESLDQFFQENCLPESSGRATVPSISTFRNSLTDLLDTIRMVAKEHLDEPETEEDGEGGEGDEEGSAMGKGRITNRNDALTALNKIADFFERTEPHSPISYALRQVIGFGKMSLPELWSELIRDGSVREELSRRVGVPKLSDEE